MIFNTAFSRTVKQIREKWPIIEVEESDFFDLSIPDRYKKNKYVWVVNKKYKSKILSTFDWSYSPSTNINNIHQFPLCFDDTKSPVIWDAVKLLPLINDSDVVIKSNIIAGYIHTPFYYTIYERGLINKVISKPASLRYRVAKTKPTFIDMLKSFNFQKYNKNYILFVDVDVNLDINYDFKLPDNSSNTIFHYSVRHISNNLVYADNSVIFVPYAYIDALQRNIDFEVKHDIIDDVVGELNDICDPEFAWARAYSTTGLILKNKFLYKQRKITNKILSSFLSSDCKLSKYVQNGCSQASVDVENNVDINFEDFRIISKRFADTNIKSSIQSDNMKPLLSKLEMIKRIYGEDSDQYKTMLSKLESIQPVR